MIPAARLGEFKSGAFLLAIKAETPVVPVSIHGTFAVLPMHSWNVPPGPVELLLHPPVPTAGMTSASSEALAARVRETIARDLAEPPSTPSH